MQLANRVLLAALLACGVGCRATPPPAADNARILELEERTARLETQAKPAELEDQILALKVERAGLPAAYTPEHPAVLKIEHRIRALENARAAEDRARRDRMRRQLEAERAQLLVTYAPDHDLVRRLDAKIAFLETDAG